MSDTPALQQLAQPIGGLLFKPKYFLSSPGNHI